jgi:hypothetical protein
MPMKKMVTTLIISKAKVAFAKGCFAKEPVAASFIM